MAKCLQSTMLERLDSKFLAEQVGKSTPLYLAKLQTCMTGLEDAFRQANR